MPREGTGRSDNAIETGHNIIHGAGDEKLSSHVDRADKAAPLPKEKGKETVGKGNMVEGGGGQGAEKTGAGQSG